MESRKRRRIEERKRGREDVAREGGFSSRLSSRLDFRRERERVRGRERNVRERGKEGREERGKRRRE